MARDWPHLPKFQAEEDAAAVAPEGWSTRQIEDIFDKLEIGKRFDQKTSFASGKVPVVDQSADGFVGYHDEQPGVVASNTSPVITFANHTCEMRVMRRPFSLIQNVFPMVGRLGVCETLFFYYATKGRVHLEEYKGHYPDFRRLWINLPPLPEQKAIASVLGALDDKIELNRRMNATLESIARAIFRSWFVDFDPVRANMDRRGQPSPQPSPTGRGSKVLDPALLPSPAGRRAGDEGRFALDPATAALFPDSFQDSELGHIPKGWEVRSLDKTAHYLNGLALQKYPPGDGPTLPVIKIAQLRKGDSIGADRCNTNLPREYVVQDGDVLFSWSGSLEVELWCGGPGALNQHLFKVTSPEFPKWFYYLWTLYHLDEFRLIAADKATTMGHIQRGHLTAAKVLIPPRPLLDAMTRTMSPLIDQLIANRIQSRTLATLRDTLLPKLLSGEFSVAQAPS